MNIFAVSPYPSECAKALDDKRLVKMVLETAQILTTAAILNGATNLTYKPTHKNHPCVKWAAKNKMTGIWLFLHFQYLLAEYKFRFGKDHACSKLTDELSNTGEFFNGWDHEPFPNCTTNKAKGISFKHIEDVHEAYRLYLNARWKTDKIKPKWTNREKPSWANYED